MDSHSQKTLPPIPRRAYYRGATGCWADLSEREGCAGSGLNPPKCIWNLLKDAVRLLSRSSLLHRYSVLVDIWSTQTSVPHCNTPEVPCWCMISPAGHPLIAWRSGSWMRGKMLSRPLVQGTGSGCHTCLVVSKYHGHL